jgi:hypothetical protein
LMFEVERLDPKPLVRAQSCCALSGDARVKAKGAASLRPYSSRST